ncbi:hypothetical protein DL769_001650 [Monosporascus sp. CRB-8-3]|nr:hypothetical protein DL769_001650 [Monosporascus sp. CRB-8-3]
MDLTGDPDCPCCSARRHERWASVAELKSVSEEGCPYCSLLLQGLLHLDPEVESRLGYDAKIRFKQRRDMVVYRDPNGSRGQQPGLKDVKLQYEFYKAGSDRAYKPVGNTSSDTSYSRMYWWIQTCLTDHALCGMGEPTPPPTRLLHLGDDLADDTPNIKLIEPSAELRERYIALSHSWGKEQPLRTTMATLEDHKAGIPFARLPKTFQDAVSITRRLGIRYLWIDSLCIIQDSSDDWQIEASRMASVYRNSWLTVSGTASSSPSSGCYRYDQAVDVQLPDEDGDDPLAVLFPAATKLRRELRLHLRFTFEHPEPGPWSNPREKDAFPLLSRAWAYQERLLAPRVLHFGPQELFWECMQDQDCECGSMKWSNAQNMGSYINRNTSGELPPKISHYAAMHVGMTTRQVDDTKKKQKLLSRWEEMVAEYTKRELTFPSDRLPAFSGMASEMATALGMKYCAGLWEETLPLGLLWERSLVSDKTPVLAHMRPAPSWSWAALNAPVNFLVSLGGPYRQWEMPHVSAELGEVRVAPVGKDERGQVRLQESYITLFSELVHAKLGFATDSYRRPWISLTSVIAKGQKGLEHDRLMVKVGQAEPVQFRPDFELCDELGNGSWKEYETLYCAKIATASNTFYWLVLRRVPGEDSTYERVGVIQNTDADWETDGVKQQVRII